MIPTDKLYIAATIALSVLRKIRLLALEQEPITAGNIADATYVIDKLDDALLACKRPEPEELDLSVWEAAIEELEIDL